MPGFSYGDETSMDQLTPLLNQTALSANVFFSGQLCNTVDFNGDGHVGHIHVLKAGTLELDMGANQRTQIRAPAVLFFPRPSRHRLLPVDAMQCELVCAMINLGTRNRSPLAMALPEFSLISLDQHKNFMATLDLLFVEAFADFYGRQSALNRLAEYFLIQLLRQVIADGNLNQSIFSALADPRLAKAVQMMHERPDMAWTLEMLAEEAGMSRARFAAHFRDLTGLTPLDYLTDWRLSVVQHLLLQGKSLKAIAPLVGYQSQATLSRIFAKKLQIAPSEWIDIQRTENAMDSE